MASILSQLAKKEQLSRRQTPESVAKKLVNGLSDVQKAFILDKHRLKIARCGRRAGKSHADAAYMIIACLSRPKANVLYLGITQSSAMDIMWQPLTDMLHKFKIVHRALPSSKVINFPNGSKIKLFGADSENAKNRLRGVAYDLVIVDECGYVAEVDALVDVVLPSVADYGGTICLTSSPPDVLKGLFYDADQGRAKAFWHQYSWTLLDNPFFMGPAEDPKYKSRGEEEMALICNLKYGGNTDHPAFRREYYGEWVHDTSKLLYPYTGANLSSERLSGPKVEYIIGLDFGVATSSAISVLAYTPGSRHVQVVHTWKDHSIMIDEFATILRRIMVRYPPTVMVGDAGGLGKAFIQELTRRYNLPIRNAIKTEKDSAQRLVANDLLSRYITVLVPDCQMLVDEWAVLKRADDGKEEKGTENHCSDATLYAYRHIVQIFEQNEQSTPESIEDRHINQLIREMGAENDDNQYY